MKGRHTSMSVETKVLTVDTMRRRNVQYKSHQTKSGTNEESKRKRKRGRSGDESKKNHTPPTQTIKQA